MGSLTDLAGNLSESTAQVLTALRIVATRAEVDEIAVWAKKELAGYGEEDDLPAYRSWGLTIKANLYDQSGQVVNDGHVGDSAIDRKYRKKVTTYHCRSGVWQIEYGLADRDIEICDAEIPNLAQLINAGPFGKQGWNCTHATAQFSVGHLTTVVNNARQTALEFCLKCEKEGVDLLWGEDDKADPESRNKWIEMIKEEGTKAILRTAWNTAWKGVIGAV